MPTTNKTYNTSRRSRWCRWCTPHRRDSGRSLGNTMRSSAWEAAHTFRSCSLNCREERRGHNTLALPPPRMTTRINPQPRLLRWLLIRQSSRGIASAWSLLARPFQSADATFVLPLLTFKPALRYRLGDAQKVYFRSVVEMEQRARRLPCRPRQEARVQGRR